MKKPQVEESSADEVPAYIVTFSDMVTLLLTFFVLLLSLADVQDPELMNKGRDSFVKAFNHCGLGIFSGKNLSPGFSNNKTKYLTSEDDKSSDRTIDEEQEKLLRLFNSISKSMTAMPSQVQARQTQFFAVPIQFASAQSKLNNQDKSVIKQFIVNLRQNITAQNATLYVVALGDSGKSDRDRFMLSARRAQTVADYLRSQLPDSPRWSILNWGAGSGGKWTSRDGILDDKSQVMIVVLKK